MDVQTVMTLIGSLGFPIVACGGLFWFIVKSMNTSNEKTVQAIEKLEQSIAENTSAVNSFIKVFDYVKDKGGADVK